MANSKMAATAAKSKIEESNIIDLWQAWRTAGEHANIANKAVRTASEAVGSRPSVLVGQYSYPTFEGAQPSEFRADTVERLELGVGFLQQFKESKSIDWEKRSGELMNELAGLLGAWEKKRAAAGLPDLLRIEGEALKAWHDARKRLIEDPRRGMLAIAAKLHVAWVSTRVGVFGGRSPVELCTADALEGLLHLLPPQMAEAIKGDLEKREKQVAA